MLKGIVVAVGGLIVVLGISWVLVGNEFFLYKVFAPKQEAVRRQTFEQSRAFNEGMVRDFENLRMQYLQSSDPDAKAVLVSTILHRSAGYNLNDPSVPADLRNFITQLQQKHLGAR